MLECFKDIITLRGHCSDAASVSGLLINDIGISNEELDSMVTKDYNDSFDFFQQKRDFSIKQIVANIHANFVDKYKANSILKSGRIGFTKENLVQIAGENGKMKGIQIELCNQDSFVDIFISSISLQVNHTGNVDIKVYDLFQGKLLDTIPITAIANEIVTVYPYKTYKSDRRAASIIFVYDTTNSTPFGIASVETTVTKGGCKECGSGGTMMKLNQYLSTQSIMIDVADTKIDGNLEGSPDTGGMSIMYEIHCNHEDWLCTISSSVAMPILYKTGAEIMEFALHASNRVNTETILDFDKIRERLELYDLRYKESMLNLLQNMKLPDDEKCFECRIKSKHAIILP